MTKVTITQQYRIRKQKLGKKIIGKLEEEIGIVITKL